MQASLFFMILAGAPRQRRSLLHLLRGGQGEGRPSPRLTRTTPGPSASRGKCLFGLEYMILMSFGAIHRGRLQDFLGFGPLPLTALGTD